MPAIIDISVVLPAPLYPTIAMNSPSRTLRLMSRRTSTRAAPFPYPFDTLRSSSSATGHLLPAGGLHAEADQRRGLRRQDRQPPLDRRDRPQPAGDDLLEQPHDQVEEESD